MSRSGSAGHRPESAGSRTKSLQRVRVPGRNRPPSGSPTPWRRPPARPGQAVHHGYAGNPSRDSPAPDAARARGRSAPCEADPDASEGNGPRGGAREDHGAGEARYPDAPAAVPGAARCAGAGAAAPPGTPDPRSEPHPVFTELTFQHHKLMTQRQDLHVPAVVAQRQQAQHRERVRHAQAGQSQQHDWPSCPGDPQPPRAPIRASVLETPVYQLPPGRITFPAGARSLGKVTRPRLHSFTVPQFRQTRRLGAKRPWSCTPAGPGGVPTCATFSQPGQRTRTDPRKSYLVLRGSRNRWCVEIGLIRSVCEPSTKAPAG